MQKGNQKETLKMEYLNSNLVLLGEENVGKIKAVSET